MMRLQVARLHLAPGCLLLTLALGSCGTALEGAAPPDSSVRPGGEGWYCSSEASHMLSVCERSDKLCKRARRYLVNRQVPRGALVVFSGCRPQKTAYCYTALRREVPDTVDDGDGDEDSDDESAEEMEPVVKEKVWLCHATRANCESNRDNMYVDGFTDVSQCRGWR